MEAQGLTDRLAEVLLAVAFEGLVRAEEEVDLIAEGKSVLHVIHLSAYSPLNFFLYR